MSLVWKLLRRHISWPQFIGFFFANLFGMTIVLLGIQFYRDILPVFTAKDSFLSADYLIISKKVGSASTLSGGSNSFSPGEIDELASQKFVTEAAKFTSASYKVDAQMGINGVSILNSELYFESVPDDFIDVKTEGWKFMPGAHEVPVILPRSYITMYNFGFAQSHSLPKISEGLAGMIDLKMFVQGNGHKDEYKGKVIGFSSRLNTILVPQAFMDWSNKNYSNDAPADPTRLILKVDNPAGSQISSYLEEHGYEAEDNNLSAEKTTSFLRMTVSLVLVVGLVIAALSFFILMLSIYLLVQKNSTKLENLLLIGYSPGQVARPYQMLTVFLNVAVLVIALVLLFLVRNYYMGVVETLFPTVPEGSLLPAVVTGVSLLLLVSLANMMAVRRKVNGIWRHKDVNG